MVPNPKTSIPQAPEFWGQVPLAAWRKLDLSRVVLDALLARQDPKPYGVSIALTSLDSYAAAARRQHKSITRLQTTMQRARSRGRSTIFEHVHFYLIAWTRVAKLARFVSSRTRFRRVGLTLRRYSSDLAERVSARDHVEHFEERLPGGPKEAKLARRGDLLNMVGTSMSYGGERVDVGPASAALLAAFVREFRLVLLYDAVEALAETDLPALKRHVDRAATELRIERFSRKVMREWGRANATRSTRLKNEPAEQSLATAGATRRS